MNDKTRTTRSINSQQPTTSDLLSQLKTSGAFTSRTPHKINVKWKNPDTGVEHNFDFSIANRNTKEEEEYGTKISEAREKKSKSLIAEIISSTLVDPANNNNQAMDYDTACKLQPSLSEAICVSIAEFYNSKKK